MCSKKAGRSPVPPKRPAAASARRASGCGAIAKAITSCATAPRGRRRSPSRLSAERVRAIEALRRLRMTAAEIAEILQLPLSTVSAVAQADRSRQALAARATRAAQPLRASPSRRARARRHQEARPHPGCGPPRDGQPGLAGEDAPRGPPARGCRLGVRARDGRRPLTPCLRGGARRPHRELCRRLPPPCSRLVCRARSDGQGGDERQRGLLRRARVRRRARTSLACATCASGPAGHAPTARPSASSRRCSASGRTDRSTAAQTSAPPTSRASSSATTSGVHTAPSANRCRPRG